MIFQLNKQSEADSKLQFWGAIAFFSMALCYICLFITFGLVLDFPSPDNLGDLINYVAKNQSIVIVAYFLGYLIFGILLLVGVQAIHNRLSTFSSHLLNTGSTFGLIWVVLMMCSGMIAVIGINTMVKLHTTGSPYAETLFYVYSTITNSLGGGIELVGGLWVFLLSVVGLRFNQFSKSLNFLGLIVGTLGILTLYQGIPEFKDAFGLSQIIWFAWMGVVLLIPSRKVQA